MYSLTHTRNEASKNSKRKARANFRKVFHSIEMSSEDRFKLLQAFHKVLDAYS